MQPQNPNHPAPPEPGMTPHVPASSGTVNSPHSYSAPQFGSAQPAPPQQNQDYNFIFEAKAAPKRVAVDPSSSLTKVIFIGAGIFLLLIIFVIVKSALSSSPQNIQAIDLVMEDQSEIVHIAQEAYVQQGTSQETQNSCTTLQPAAASAQNLLLAYLKKIGVKTKPSLLLLHESKATDSTLTSAATNGIYDQTYYSIMKSELATYAENLKQAYSLTTGTNGRALLASEYKGALLLYKQLTSPVG